MLSSYHQRLIWCWLGIRCWWLEVNFLLLHYLGSNLISWSSKKQKVLSWSSTKAEYRSLAFVVTDIKGVLSLLHELWLSHHTTMVYLDNQSAMLLTQILSFIHEHFEYIMFMIKYKNINSLSSKFLSCFK